MNVFKLIKNKNGFSLIELILTLALLGMVLSVGYNFFFFGQASFNRGETQTIIQSYTRNTAAVITKDVRNAVEIELVDTYQLPGVNEFIIYLDSNTIYKKNEDGDILYQTEPFILNLDFNIVEVNEKFVLVFIITGEKDGKTYTLESNVLLNNISDFPDGYLDTEDYTSVIYLKP